MKHRVTGGAVLAATLALGACGPSPTPVDGGTDAAPSTLDAGADAIADAASDGGTTAAEQVAWQRLLAAAQRAMTAGHAPGASIAIVLHGRLAFAAGVGVRDTDSGDPVTTATLFRVASMSKMLLAATAMSLARDGMLDVQQPITHYLPWFHLAPGFDAGTVTLAQLLSHNAGFPADTISQCGVGSDGPRQDFFTAQPQPLWTPPGAVFDYSNTGFALAAEVLTAAAGRPDADYEQLVHDRVFVPAGMTTATYDASAAVLGDHATGYELDGTGAVYASEALDAIGCPLLTPPGGAMATATDYAHFAEMLIANGGTTLDAAGVAAMESAHVDTREFASQGYGYGLFHQLVPFHDHPTVWHGGSLPGFLSEMLFVPDLGFAVVALTNARGTLDVSDAIVGAALTAFVSEAEVWPHLTPDVATWPQYAGTYDDHYGTLGTGVVVSVRGADDGGTPALAIDAPNARDLITGRVVPVHGALQQVLDDAWVMPDGTDAAFFPDATGAFRYFVTRRGIAVR